MGLGKSGSWDSAPLAHDVGTPVREKKEKKEQPTLSLSVQLCAMPADMWPAVQIIIILGMNTYLEAKDEE